MTATEKAGEVLAKSLEGMRQAESAVAQGRWKAAFIACVRVARVARLHAHERLPAAVLAQTVLALAPLARKSPQRMRRLLELLDEAVEARPHDLDLAHALHDVLAELLEGIRRADALPGRQRRALARLGLTYGRPLCGRFPKETAFAETCAALLELAQKA